MTVKLPELWLQYASMAYSHAKDIDTVLRMLVRERINSGSMPKDDII